MTCPHCRKELPVDYGDVICPACGASLDVELPRVKTNWWIFFGVMLAPALVTCLAVSAGAKNSGFPVCTGLFGGGAAGIICGIMLARHVGKTMPGRMFFGFLFCGVLIVACVGMSMFGCLASGYALNF